MHLLLDKHYNEQVLIMDSLAERVQTLGGVAFALAQEAGDDSSNDLIVSQVVRSNELHSGFIGEHLAAQARKAN
ncbi:hypothetical protein [Massilia scottii]|uniref:hypothetical protein n=1 Tax=Massilia scottii TaxID=3057166 RepID=UPI0027967D68|nr:hypothetical protein [Massilia sp. CCM 9029]MDQ1829311.1 hypothetical protein [Massilia sp. CCM 9029]